MRIFKYRTFEKWAKKQNMTNGDIKIAIEEISQGLIDAKLCKGVYKKRIGLHGKGKRSSHRTIILMKIGEIAIFTHGFSKNEKDNITKSELDSFKALAEVFLNLKDKQIDQMIRKRNLIEVL
jgi:hypothetical protein